MTDELRLPNLFLIGAPKSGTSAMSHYLAGHPDVFMSEQAGVKEPRFFSSDLRSSNMPEITVWEQYCRLFESVPASVTYLGEATVRYLRSKVAVPEILRTVPDPLFVVMLRNPIELVVSQHNQKVKEGFEDQTFEKAWQLQGERARGFSRPPKGGAMQYGPHAMLGEQMKRLFETVDRSRVHCIWYDDFKVNPGQSYRNLLEFLGLPDDGRTEFERRNRSVRFRSSRLQKIVRKLVWLRNSLGLPNGMGVRAIIDRFNVVPSQTELALGLKRELQDYFADDVALLAEVTGRDLSAWQTI